MPNIKKQFKEICKEYGVVGASLEIYENNKTKSMFYGKAAEDAKTSKKWFRINQIFICNTKLLTT